MTSLIQNNQGLRQCAEHLRTKITEELFSRAHYSFERAQRSVVKWTVTDRQSGPASCWSFVCFRLASSCVS